ncbi:MerC domain-containing protein [Rhizorhabdus dicambivorans]|uniref:MerC domain-containing protein n=1 Tax=Rhizorhabdus dicambivorans TaxID=1850238 RepID=A0A2A4FSB2_9SPHN|nr:MerC domain-containing protein [Rhizorhabdus dicambivorans]ATE66441.1 MerC domain-containing protein [Rhizorhabdus dicambivorans]PCE41067.1 MerC domain-containing protein [Rhizorhabdus dicambivorans]
MVVTRSTSARDLFDRLAIGLSALCFVHCAASVVLVTLLATAGGALLHPAIHEVGLGFAILLAIIGLGRGFVQHRKRVPMVLGTLGIALMAAALSVPHGVGEAAFTMLGVSCVAIAHMLNRRANIL